MKVYTRSLTYVYMSVFMDKICNKSKVYKLGPRYHDARYIFLFSFFFSKSSKTCPYILTLKNIPPCVYDVQMIPLL